MVEAVAGGRWSHRRQPSGVASAPQRRSAIAEAQVAFRLADVAGVAAGLAATFGRSADIQEAVRGRFAEAPIADGAARLRTRRVPAQDTASRLAHEHARQVVEDLRGRWLRVPGTDTQARLPWWAHLPMPLAPTLDPGCPPYAPAGTAVGSWLQEYVRPQGGAVEFDHAAETRPHNYLAGFWHSLLLLSTRAVEEVDFAHVGASWRPAFGAMNFGHGCGLGGPQPRVRQAGERVRWSEATMRDRQNRLRYGPLGAIYGGSGTDADGGETGWEDAHQRLVYARRTTYMIVHEIVCVRLPDRYPLPWRSAAMRLDAGQWAWTLQLELLGQNAAGLIQPGGDTPVEIEIGLNGTTWIFLAEDWSEARAFGDTTSVRVTGRSRTAWLSDRYSRPRDYAETQARTMAQLAEQELPLGGGWTLTWDCPDWAVPAGAWSYQHLAPIQAIARLAAAAGGLIYPHPSDKTLTVRPAWAVLPWEMESGQEDVLIPLAAVLAMTRRYRYPDQANAVHVAGTETGGIQALVYRDGSAGDELAADAVEPLTTHPDGARALGGRILADLARPCGVAAVTTAVHAEDFPVPALGDLARIDTDGGQMGPVMSIDLGVAGGDGDIRVRQTLGIGQAENDYHRLLALVPTEPRRLAQITAVHGDGTATVEFPGGGTARVRGSGSADAWVWVRAGRVEDAAPALSGYAIAV